MDETTAITQLYILVEETAQWVPGFGHDWKFCADFIDAILKEQVTMCWDVPKEMLRRMMI